MKWTVNNRFALVERVGRALVEAPGLDGMLRALGTVIVPALVDVCVVRLGDGDDPMTVAWFEADSAARAASFREAVERYAALEHPDMGPRVVRRTGVSDHVADCAPASSSSTTLQILRDAGVRSYSCVPLVAHGSVYGTLSLATFARALVDDDRRVAELIAGPACFAIRAEQLHVRSAAAEAALREREAELSAIVECALDAIVVADDHGRYLAANGAAATLFGRPVEEILGLTVKDVTVDGGGAALGWTRFCAASKVRRGTYGLRRPDGEVREVEYAATPHFVPGKHVAILRDVTERKRLEEQLHQAQKMEAVGRLAGGVAHDFNNLLTAINGYSELVLAALSPGDPLHRHVEQVRKAGDRAAALTHQLLAFSRRQVLQPRVINLNGVVGDLTRMLRRVVGEDIDLRTRLAPELGNVRADPRRIEQVLMNLVVNARDAMPGGGGLVVGTQNVSLERAITIGTSNEVLDRGCAQGHPDVAPGDYVMLSVSDTGCGMDAATLTHMFEPFFTTKGPGRGTGLGLSTAYGIVKQSGGHIFVYSEVGVGTTFKVYLPRVDETVTAAAPPLAPSAPGRDEVVLVVEDDDTVRELVATALRGHGYRALEARNGGEALLVCERPEQRIDLLLTDVIMPRMTGPELRARLGRLRPDLPALFMSGYTDDALAPHGVLEPGTAFLEKPFTPEALARAVGALLDRAAPAAAAAASSRGGGVDLA